MSMSMDINEKKQKILDILGKEKEIATTKIAFLITANLYQTEIYLEELFEDKLILFEKRSNATYWRLNGKK